MTGPRIRVGHVYRFRNDKWQRADQELVRVVAEQHAYAGLWVRVQFARAETRLAVLNGFWYAQPWELRPVSCPRRETR